ncbi:TPR end-of-group domain-containing protein [Muriicola marianensis]|uniref:Adenylate cyclase n=1 Tax=Muriicola marianensis TaxID=1324801 RepID=A0ABQ1R5V3_9FLAO|nr:adenylate/guanylate cyclase domain-containing protein [Muriicola marianensis]GGD57379.1 adenylate cyclase [Muriicola marianensis]
MHQSVEKQLAAIMFTDIVGYTTMMGQDETKTLELLRQSRAIHLEQIRKHDGEVIKEMGDGMLARFANPLDATLCARDIQLDARNLLCKIRIGIDFGEVTVEQGDVFGNGVNIASRLQSIADPGGIFLSSKVRESIGNDCDIIFDKLGELPLKNVALPVTTYAIADPEFPKTSHHRKKELSGSDIIESIAVLPFHSLSGDPEQQFFVDGMHDALITELAQINSLRVISRTSTLRYRNTTSPMLHIAGDLGVDAIVEATVFKDKNHIRIQVQLIKTIVKEEHLWAKSYDRELKNVLSMYNELVKDITEEIDAKLTQRERDQVENYYEVIPEAYETYLKGVHYWEQLSKEGLDRSLECFLKSTQLDPNFAPAYTAMAGVWLGRAQMGFVNQAKALPNVYKNMYRSMSLDGENAESYFWRASLHTWIDWEWDKAYKAFKRALELNPNNAKGRAYFAHLLAITNRLQEAVAEAELSIQLDPFNELIQSLYGMVLNYARKFRSAEAILLNIIKDRGNHPIAYSTLRTVYFNLGEYDRSYEMFKVSYLEKGEARSAEILEEGFREGGYPTALSGVAEYKSEDRDGAYHTPWQIATLYTRAGNSERAIEYLKKAYEIRDPNMPYLGIDPIFDRLRDLPEYQELLNQMYLNQFFNKVNHESN